MSIQKKSLISTLKTAKKANVASAPLAEAGDVKGTKGVKMATTKASFSKRAVALKAAHYARPTRIV
jgi:hypothetical protein